MFDRQLRYEQTILQNASTHPIPPQSHQPLPYSSEESISRRRSQPALMISATWTNFTELRQISCKRMTIYFARFVVTCGTTSLSTSSWMGSIVYTNVSLSAGAWQLGEVFDSPCETVNWILAASSTYQGHAKSCRNTKLKHRMIIDDRRDSKHCCNILGLGSRDTSTNKQVLLA